MRSCADDAAAFSVGFFGRMDMRVPAMVGGDKGQETRSIQHFLYAFKPAVVHEA
jgi:hypothetical protein